MYEYKEIEKEIERSFKAVDEKTTALLKSECREILEDNIEIAIERIKGLRKNYHRTQKVERWLRLLIFNVIYNYLSTSEPKMKQNELLKKMELSPDIFTKHWHMYSPDFKVRQKVFPKIDIGYAKDEIESNEIYVAMVHYLITSANIPTRTFVDAFGKMGIIPVLCANGYSHRKLIMDNKYLEKSLKALSKPIKIYKYMEQIQREIKAKEKMFDKWELILKLREQYVLQIYYDSLDEYEYAAKYFFVCYFEPEYWEDSNLKYKLGKDYKNLNALYDWEMDDTTLYKYNKIKKFEQLSKENFQIMSRLYGKLEVVKGNIQNMLIDESGMYSDLLCPSNFFYIDIPKYFREQERFNFHVEDYYKVIELLEKCTGNWVLTWKNYYFRDDCSDDVKRYALLADELGDFAKADVLYDILKRIGNIQYISNRKLHIFKYRTKDRNKTESILFITNVDFEEIDTIEFAKRYNISMSGTLIKQDFDNLYESTKKFFPPQYWEQLADGKKKL